MDFLGDFFGVNSSSTANAHRKNSQSSNKRISNPLKSAPNLLNSISRAVNNSTNPTENLSNIPFTLDSVKRLCTTLKENSRVTQKNHYIVIETLRILAELMVWGDQHNELFFLYFCEKNMLVTFLDILSCNPHNKVVVQLLQTLCMMIQNLGAETSFYYLMSNNYINDIIVHNTYDFADEEVVNWYISLLKTLSLRLNSSTLHFFFDDRTKDFPLCTESIKFLANTDNMIRIAVRTISLNVYRVGMENESLSKYLYSHHALSNFFGHVFSLKTATFQLNNIATSGELLDGDIDLMKKSIDDFVDCLFYLQDIFYLEAKELSEALSDQLLAHYILPVLVGSLMTKTNLKVADHDLVCVRVALFMLSNIFYAIKYPPLINATMTVLLRKESSVLTRLLIEDPPRMPVVLGMNSDLRHSSISSVLINDSDEKYSEEETEETPEAARHSSELLRPTDLDKEILKQDLNLQKIRSRTDGARVSYLTEIYKGFDLSGYENINENSPSAQFMNLIELDQEETTVFWWVICISFILKNTSTNSEELIRSGVCPRKLRKSLGLLKSLISQSNENIQADESLNVLERLIAQLRRAILGPSTRIFTLRAISSLIATLAGQSSKEQLTQFITPEEESELVAVLSSVHNELKNYLESISLLPEKKDLLYEALLRFNTFDDETIHRKQEDFDVTAVLQNPEYLLPLIDSPISPITSQYIGGDLENRLPFAEEEKIRFFIMFYEMLVHLFRKLGIPQPKALLSSALFEESHVYSIGRNPYITADAVSERECYILASDTLGRKKMFIHVEKEHLILIDRHGASENVGKVEMSSHCLRTELSLSDSQEGLGRLLIKSVSRPGNTAKLAFSRPGDLYKFWNIAVMFNSAEDGRFISQKLRASKIEALKTAFPFLEDEEAKSSK